MKQHLPSILAVLLLAGTAIALAVVYYPSTTHGPLQQMGESTPQTNTTSAAAPDVQTPDSGSGK